jgi:hypothetical protein
MNPPEKTKTKLEMMREKRVQDRAASAITSIAMQSWILPLGATGLAIAASAIINSKLAWLSIATIIVILYSSTCSIRTWINYAQGKSRGLLVPAVIGSLINLFLLCTVAFALSLIIAKFGFR